MIFVVTTNGIFVVDTSLYSLLYTFQQIAELLILLKDFDHKVCFIISHQVNLWIYSAYTLLIGLGMILAGLLVTYLDFCTPKKKE